MKFSDAAELASELFYSIKDLEDLINKDDPQQLNCGLHMLSIYEKLMLAMESEIHPAYRKNIEQFRKEKLP